MLLSILLIGVSLSMDAFAVSVTNGLTLKDFRLRHALWMGLYFGGFQFLMPLLGCLLGSTVSHYIMRFGPYISFVLLGYIGVKMILDAVKSGEDDEAVQSLSHSRLFALAVATSIDALAVGVSFAFSPPSPGIWLSCALIGCTTFVLTLLAAVLGSRFSLHPRKAGILGGAVLLCIGVKLLLEGIL